MLSPWLDGIAISAILSVSGHGQKGEKTLSQVPVEKTVEFTNSTGNMGNFSEMVGEDGGDEDSRESGHFVYT